MIFSAPIPEIDVPTINLADFVLADVDSRRSKPAVIDAVSGLTLTYGELDEMSARAAGGLLRDGIRPGDVVALISNNQPMYAVAVYAILRAGAVVSPINPVLNGSEIGKQLATAGAKAVVAATGGGWLAEAVVGTQVEACYSFDDSADTRSFRALLSSAPAISYQPASTNDLAALPFSSGTSGTSKGVMLSHGNLVANLIQLHDCWALDAEAVVCAAMPLFHIYGFTVILNSAILAGATVITMPRFDLRGYLEVVQNYRVTLGHLAPPLVLALATAPEVDQYDLTSMTRAISGAAPLDEELAARVEERTGIRIRQGYGMTEASPGTHGAPSDEFVAIPAGSVGHLLSGTTARIVDPATGEDVGVGSAGELWVRGPQIMQGYLGLPEETDATIVEGWLRTGDVVEHRDGCFYVVDRLKELIKYKGYQVAPAELEALLLQHPQIADAAVVGLADRVAGELPTAYVVHSAADPGPSDADAIIAWVAERVAPYKKIRRVAFIDRIPKSPAGKILRRVLRDLPIEEPAMTARDELRL